jgi:hypothetical protein
MRTAIFFFLIRYTLFRYFFIPLNAKRLGSFTKTNFLKFSAVWDDLFALMMSDPRS